MVKQCHHPNTTLILKVAFRRCCIYQCLKSNWNGTNKNQFLWVNTLRAKTSVSLVQKWKVTINVDGIIAAILMLNNMELKYVVNATYNNCSDDCQFWSLTKFESIALHTQRKKTAVEKINSTNINNNIAYTQTTLNLIFKLNPIIHSETQII
jgi:hypothetical protein